MTHGNDEDPLGALANVSMALPDPLRGSGRLFLGAPSEDAFEQLRQIAERTDRVFDVYDPDRILAIHVHKDDVVGFLGQVRQDLSSVALEDTKALFKSGTDEPTLGDFPRADSLKNFLIFARGKWLAEIMREERLLVHFQPIVYASDTGRVYGHEALARGRSRTGDLIAPMRMLSAARDAGSLSSLDGKVHERAIQMLATSRAEGELFLNITPSTVVDAHFEAERHRQLADTYDVAPERIVFEITESEKLTDSDQLVRSLDAGRAQGFRLALDDLGAGFSNMNLIHRVRPDIVKLDMDLTRNIHEDDYKSVIAEKIIEIAQSLDIATVAEGVEKPEELEWVRSRGVEFVQGFLTGHPEELPRDTVDISSAE
jgi:EAL domain-containing protein (putative c-di-GMP-specific phosphodiesterase class I)